VIWGKREAKYFRAQGWTGFRTRAVICPSGNGMRAIPLAKSNVRMRSKFVIASEAKQSRGHARSLSLAPGLLRRFAPRNDGGGRNRMLVKPRAGYPVRRGLSFPTSMSLEYWIIRFRG
jgi:hypothetical protein